MIVWALANPIPFPASSDSGSSGKRLAEIFAPFIPAWASATSSSLAIVSAAGWLLRSPLHGLTPRFAWSRRRVWRLSSSRAHRIAHPGPLDAHQPGNIQGWPPIRENSSNFPDVSPPRRAENSRIASPCFFLLNETKSAPQVGEKLDIKRHHCTLTVSPRFRTCRLRRGLRRGKILTNSRSFCCKKCRCVYRFDSIKGVTCSSYYLARAPLLF